MNLFSRLTLAQSLSAERLFIYPTAAGRWGS